MIVETTDTETNIPNAEPAAGRADAACPFCRTDFDADPVRIDSTVRRLKNGRPSLACEACLAHAASGRMELHCPNRSVKAAGTRGVDRCGAFIGLPGRAVKRGKKGELLFCPKCRRRIYWAGTPGLPPDGWRATPPPRGFDPERMERLLNLSEDAFEVVSRLMDEDGDTRERALKTAYDMLVAGDPEMEALYNS